MAKHIELLLVLMVSVVIIVIFPLMAMQSLGAVTKNSIEEKKLADFCYRIETEKKLDIGDLSFVSAEVSAYDDRSGHMIMTSWEEISAELENNGTYEFENVTHVRVIYDGRLIRCVRVH